MVVTNLCATSITNGLLHNRVIVNICFNNEQQIKTNTIRKSRNYEAKIQRKFIYSHIFLWIPFKDFEYQPPKGFWISTTQRILNINHPKDFGYQPPKGFWISTTQRILNINHPKDFEYQPPKGF